jgi:hypothetical protein
MLCLLTRSIGETDDGESRQSPLKVRLDLDAASFETHEGVRDGSGEHASTVRGHV